VRVFLSTVLACSAPPPAQAVPPPPPPPKQGGWYGPDPSVGTGGQKKPEKALAEPVPFEPTNQRSAVGVNLAQVSYSTSSQPFANAFSMAMPWVSRTVDVWGDGRTIAQTEDGWVVKLETKQHAATLVPTGPGGRYVIVWEGKGRLIADDPAKVVDARPNRILIETPPHTEFVLNLVEVDEKEPPKDIAVVPERLEKSYRLQVFHPLFLERLAPFRVLRFLDWSRINGLGLAKWEHRAREHHAFQSTDAGVAYEYQIELVNRLAGDLWLCIPHLADDDFVRQLAGLVKADLHPEGKVYVEWSNEVWNDSPAFGQSAYAKNRGLEARLDDDPNVARLKYQARRSVQVFDIFTNVFAGSTDRVVRVMASQSGNAWAHEQLLSFEKAYAKTDALAIAPYFGGDIGHYSKEAWIIRSKPDEILDEVEKKSLPEAIRWIQDSAKVAAEYRLPLIAYEGGSHVVASPDIHNNPEVDAKMDAVNRSPRMKAMVLELLRAWRAAGGRTFVYYSFASPPGKWGRWGALDFVDQPFEEAPKYQALVQWSEANPKWW
jgi:hypothetical protein